MKRYIIGALLLLMAGACGKMPINGDLDGRWQIMKIAYASGEEENPERAYYSVALHTINLMKVDGMNGTEQRFGVKELTSKHLVLQSDYARLEFRKF